MNVYDKVYLIGNGRIAVDCLKILFNYRKDVIYLIIGEEKFGFSTKFCERNKILCLHVSRENIEKYLLSITEKTLVISAHNGYLFPREVIAKDNIKIINMHIALLPNYRGMNVPTWEIYDQQKYAGTTWHEVIGSIDSGGIIVQDSFEIDKHDTAMKVLQKSFRLGVELLNKNVENFLTDQYKVIYSSEKTRLYLGKEKPNGGYMDYSWNLDKKYAFLRSMDYSGTDIMPLPRVVDDNREYEIWKYQWIEDKEKVALREDEKVIKFYKGGGEESFLICWLREVV